MKGFYLAAVLAAALGCSSRNPISSSSSAGTSGGSSTGGSTSSTGTSGGATSSGGGTTTGGAACTPACGPSETCVSGFCECESSYHVCRANDGGMICTTEEADNQNCGGCGNICSSSLATCFGGHCDCLQSSQTYCVSDAGMVCTDSSTDNLNCGSCGNACTPGLLTCVSGNCVCASAPDMCVSDAGAISCVNTNNDPENCGQCGFVCEAKDTLCSSGTCICRGGEALCNFADAGGQTCVDTSANPDDCGSCGNVCTETYATGPVLCRFSECTCDPSQARLCASIPSSSPTTCVCTPNATTCATPSFASDVYPLLAEQTGIFGCSATGCHNGADPAGGLAFLDEAGNMDAGMAYAELLGLDGGGSSAGVPECDGGLPVGAPSTECACASRVSPGDPSDSFLIDLLTGNPPANCATDLPMPLDSDGGFVPLSACALQLIEQWVQFGANP